MQDMVSDSAYSKIAWSC